MPLLGEKPLGPATTFKEEADFLREAHKATDSVSNVTPPTSYMHDLIFTNDLLYLCLCA